MSQIYLHAADLKKLTQYVELSDKYVFRNYRIGMYRGCLAVYAPINDPSGPWRLLVAIHDWLSGEEESENAIALTIEDYFDMVRATKIETKGTGVIVYWPNVEI